MGARLWDCGGEWGRVADGAVRIRGAELWGRAGGEGQRSGVTLWGWGVWSRAGSCGGGGVGPRCRAGGAAVVVERGTARGAARGGRGGSRRDRFHPRRAAAMSVARPQRQATIAFPRRRSARCNAAVLAKAPPADPDPSDPTAPSLSPVSPRPTEPAPITLSPRSTAQPLSPRKRLGKKRSPPGDPRTGAAPALGPVMWGCGAPPSRKASLLQAMTTCAMCPTPRPAPRPSAARRTAAAECSSGTPRPPRGSRARRGRPCCSAGRRRRRARGAARDSAAAASSGRKVGVGGGGTRP